MNVRQTDRVRDGETTREKIYLRKMEDDESEVCNWHTILAKAFQRWRSKLD